MARQRMCQADQERYGGPEWLDLQATLEWIDDADYDTLADLEKQIQALLKPEWAETVTLLGLITKLITGAPEALAVSSQRAKLWLMLRREGVDVTLADFKPKVFLIEREPKPKDDDADPPSGSPESSPVLTPADQTPASETSTSGSTPGSPGTGE